MRPVIKIAILLTITALSACAPRGESKTLDEVFKIAKQRYASVQSVEVGAKAKEPLQTLVADLTKLESDKLPADYDKTATNIGNVLTDLSFHSSYTTRPSLGELSKQFRLIGEKSSATNPAAVKLLVSRTYSLIASELETSKFNIG
jgi:hypothetical protein